MFARMMYHSLRFMHESTLSGAASAVVNLLAGGLVHRSRPQVKLH